MCNLCGIFRLLLMKITLAKARVRSFARLVVKRKYIAPYFKNFRNNLTSKQTENMVIHQSLSFPNHVDCFTLKGLSLSPNGSYVSMSNA